MGQPGVAWWPAAWWPEGAQLPQPDLVSNSKEQLRIRMLGRQDLWDHGVYFPLFSRPSAYIIHVPALIWIKQWRTNNPIPNSPKYSSLPPRRLCPAIFLAMVILPIPKWTKVHNSDIANQKLLAKEQQIVYSKTRQKPHRTSWKSNTYFISDNLSSQTFQIYAWSFVSGVPAKELMIYTVFC